MGCVLGLIGLCGDWIWIERQFGSWIQFNRCRIRGSSFLEVRNQSGMLVGKILNSKFFYWIFFLSIISKLWIT